MEILQSLLSQDQDQTTPSLPSVLRVGFLQQEVEVLDRNDNGRVTHLEIGRRPLFDQLSVLTGISLYRYERTSEMTEAEVPTAVYTENLVVDDY